MQTSPKDTVLKGETPNKLCKHCRGTGHIPLITEREYQVLKLLGRGLSTKEVAYELNLSIKTVETYRGHLKEKLGLTKGSELVYHAIRHAAHHEKAA